MTWEPGCEYGVVAEEGKPEPRRDTRGYVYTIDDRVDHRPVGARKRRAIRRTSSERQRP